MKTKFLKRILAAIIASSAVLGTSGFSSATKYMPPKNKKSQSSIESDGYDGTSSEEEEEEEEGYSMQESFSDDEEEDYEGKYDEYPPYFENNFKEEKKVLGGENNVKNKAETISPKPQISKFEALLKNSIKSDADRKKFANMVLRMSKVKSLKDSIKFNLSNIVNQLDQCSDYEKARANIAGALRNFAKKGLFNGFKEKQVNELMHILNKCAKTANARKNVAGAISKFAQKGLFNGFKEKQVNELIGILNKCAQIANARANVAGALRNFAKKGLFNGFEENQVNELIGILNDCAKTANARANVVYALMEFDQCGFLKGMEKEQIDALINILKQCAQTDKVREITAFAFGEFIRNDFLSKCITQQISAISAALIECSKDENAKVNVSFSLRLLAKKLVEYSRNGNARQKIKEAAVDLVDQLMKHANDDALKWKISYIISIFSSNGLINGLSQDKILEIVNFLKSCAGDMDAKEFVASSIVSLASNHFLDSFKGQPEKLLTLVEILDECFEIKESDKKNKDFIVEKYKVGHSIRVLLLGEVEILYGGELCSNIVSVCKDPKSENSQKFLDQLIQNSLFKDLTEEGKKKFKKLLVDCLFYFD